SLSLLFLGRVLTGFCSGNSALAQSATADLTDETHRGKAFSILLGVGGLGFVLGPWIGGRLANPSWLSGSFIFASIAALVNLIMVFFFFTETSITHKTLSKEGLFKTFKDIGVVFHQPILKKILITLLLQNIGWGFFLIFSPTFLVQRFSFGPDQIGDIFAYMALIWFFATMYLNKELIGKVPLRTLILTGTVFATIGVVAFVLPSTLWPYWIIIPIALTGDALAWVNLSSILSLRAPSHLQGRVLGISGSTWSIAQTIAPLAAGPLAGWNLYSPLLVGAIIIALSFVYFLVAYKE
ncbi:MAG: MFS transporter, partial [Chlamydiae bacterium]|nr:MFS transporter [Chlamydiota bacterium]